MVCAVCTDDGRAIVRGKKEKCYTITKRCNGCFLPLETKLNPQLVLLFRIELLGLKLSSSLPTTSSLVQDKVTRSEVKF